MAMKIVKAKALRKGDIIGIAAPASPPNSIDDLNKGIRYLEQIGYRVEVGKHVYDKFGYLAGEDKHRADDLNNFISNPKVRAIFIVRGGYGSHRILSMIDYKSLKCNPKIFVGYSDITVIQLAVFKKTGLVTFAGPMLAPDFSKTISESAEELFWRLVSSTKPVGGISKYQNQPFRVLHQGKAEGILLGGNLSVISSLVGTPFIPSFSNSILMLEDIQEAPYRIDRMLQQLKLSNKFKNLSGVVLGNFSTCVAETNKPTLTVEEILDFVFDKYPLMSNAHFGHIKNALTIPYGIRCRMDTRRNELFFLESAVVN